MNIIEKLDKNNEQVNELLDEREELCRELSQKIYDEYKGEIESHDEVGKVEPVLWEDLHEDPTWKKAQLFITWSEDYVIEQLGYDPREKEFSDNLFHEVIELEGDLIEKIIVPVEDKIKDKYGSENYWVDVLAREPLEELA